MPPQITAFNKMGIYYANNIKKKKTQRKYSVNTLAPCLVLGCNNDDLIMEAEISQLEVHTVEHDLPGGGNATTHGVGLHQRFRALIHTVKCSRQIQILSF